MLLAHPTRSTRSALVAALTLTLSLGACASSDEPSKSAPPSPAPAPIAAAPAPASAGDAEITQATLLENDVYWPNQVELTEDLVVDGPPGMIQKGQLGVLVRVLDGRTMRVDFGRYGRHRVPIAKTDAVAAANRVRRGEGMKKMGPNLTLAIANRLVDSSTEESVPFRYRERKDRLGALCVFADFDDAATLESLASQLAPLQRRGGVTTVFFPKTKVPNQQVGARLRELHWAVPFVANKYSELIARSLLDDDATQPWLMLMTNDGRVVYQGPFRDDIEATLARAIDDNFSRPS